MLLCRLWLLRAAAFGEGATAAFGKAAGLLSARLGQGAIVTAAFFFLELLAAGASGALAGIFAGPSLFGAGTALLAIAPRLALGLAFGAVFSWLAVARSLPSGLKATVWTNPLCGIGGSSGLEPGHPVLDQRCHRVRGERQRHASGTFRRLHASELHDRAR